MRLRMMALAAGMLAIGGVTGCSHNMNAGDTSATAAGPTTVRVDNQGSLDMDIFVVREGGVRVRLGMATANGSTTLRIPDDQLVGGSVTSLRFVADPIGGRRNSVSSSILVTPGDQVTLQIPPG